MRCETNEESKRMCILNVTIWKQKLIYKQRTLKASIIENPCYSKRWESVALKANQFSRSQESTNERTKITKHDTFVQIQFETLAFYYRKPTKHGILHTNTFYGKPEDFAAYGICGWHLRICYFLAAAAANIRIIDCIINDDQAVELKWLLCCYSNRRFFFQNTGFCAE